MYTKKEKQFVVAQLLRGAHAHVQVSYDTHAQVEVATPEAFMELATGRSVDRVSSIHPKNGWNEYEVTVCLL
jgi:hypothetical protein